MWATQSVGFPSVAICETAAEIRRCAGSSVTCFAKEPFNWKSLDVLLRQREFGRRLQLDGRSAAAAGSARLLRRRAAGHHAVAARPSPGGLACCLILAVLFSIDSLAKLFTCLGQHFLQFVCFDFVLVTKETGLLIVSTGLHSMTWSLA